jgi:hypothetical protein
MSFVVSLADFTPVPRYDGVPFTQARIEESSTKTGAYASLGTFTLAPVDADPANPLPRSFTVENATLENGWYKVVFLDASGDTITVGPVYNFDEATYLPSVKAMGTFMRARTKDSMGNEIGTFNTNTRPTGQQVAELIQDAKDVVISKLGGAAAVTDTSAEMFRELIKYWVAMEIELGYFPEQVATGRSPYQAYLSLFNEAVENELEEGEVLPGATTMGSPKYYFPSVKLVGWETVM